ncbi:type II toxin-antitoxin system YoeB family toxin [Oenococcus oeni]|uniref:type II toxin-antitoxin system YoeB family toxin n=1 Tax=Oenococcus oeni TaxID=1247 RepID=UPI0010BB962F
MTPLAAGYYSLRINNQHRVVYTIDQKKRLVTIFSCWAHYQNTLKTAGKTKNRKNQ